MIDRVRILLVDDDTGTLETLTEIFEDMGFETQTTTTGKQALQYIERDFYNVALLDIKLPDMEGIELLADARRLRPETKCVMVTGDASLQFAVKSAREGAYWFLRKPIDVPYVEAVVRRALESQRLELLARSLVEQEGLDDRLRLIAGYLTRATQSSRIAIWLPQRDDLVPAYMRGIPEEEQRKARRAPLSESTLPLTYRHILTAGRAAVLQAWPAPEGEEPAWKKPTLLLPLQSGGRLIGMVAVADPEGGRFIEEQVRQAQTIAYIAAVSVQQGLTLKEERDTLRTLAESFLGKIPVMPGIEIAAQYDTAYAVPQIGGDYYDFVPIDRNRVGVVIGDVCGKGRSAVGYLAMAKYMLRAYARENPEPVSVITRLNEALYGEMSEECMFITLFYAIIDREAGTLTYTNAGHPAPILYHPSTGQHQELWSKSEGSDPVDGMVGALSGMRFTSQTVPMPLGSRLTLFTDGVTESRGTGEMLEYEGVVSVVREFGSGTAAALADAIHARAVEFCGGVLKDDVAVVVVANG